MKQIFTPKDAAIILRDTPIDIRSAREDDIHTIYATAMMMAIEALEKQIPLSPDFTDDYYDVAVCPRCRQYEFEAGTTTWQMAYCPDCGQAIEWKEIEPFGGEDDGNL